MQERIFKPKYNYCIDSSAFIELNQRYPMDILKPFWLNLEDIIKKGWAHSPREVLKEIAAQDDVLLQWAKKNKQMFRSLDNSQVVKLKEVLARFPKLLDHRKENADADPFLIAHALCEGCTIVTLEKHSQSNARIIKIPNVCDEYGIKYISLIELFREQGWKWSPQSI